MVRPAASAASRGEQIMSSNTESLPQAVKNAPRSNHKYVTYLNKIVESLTGNTNYTTPSPSIAAIKAAADGLAQGNASAKNGGTAAVASRNAQRKAADKLVDQFVGYVQVTVNAQAGDAATATAMIVSAGLSVGKRTKVQKPALAAKYGGVSGEVLLLALAIAKDAVYFWDYSLDQKNWTSVLQTMKASTTIAGLTVGQVYYFRFHAQTRSGIGNYSQIVSLLVH
jgi:hypothetical protein